MKTETKSPVKVGQLVFEKEAYLMVPPSIIIHDEKVNPRLDYGNMEELMNSILENGIRNPLKGYEKDGKIVLSIIYERIKSVPML
jgi:hypothetical protein